VKQRSIGRINRTGQDIFEVTPTAHNTANTDTHFIDMAMLNLGLKNNSVRSIAFAAKEIDLLIGGKSNGGVCRNVMRKQRFIFIRRFAAQNQRAVLSGNHINRS
jgi:hypothetical protein